MTDTRDVLVPPRPKPGIWGMAMTILGLAFGAVRRPARTNAPGPEL